MIYFRIYRAILTALGIRRRRNPEAATIRLQPFQKINE
jgi:hypothetical protein